MNVHLARALDAQLASLSAEAARLALAGAQLGADAAKMRATIAPYLDLAGQPGTVLPPRSSSPGVSDGKGPEGVPRSPEPSSPAEPAHDLPAATSEAGGSDVLRRSGVNLPETCAPAEAETQKPARPSPVSDGLVRRQRELAAKNDATVLAAIVEGGPRVKNDFLARKAGIERGTLFRVLGRLVADGKIRIDGITNARVVTVLQPPPPARRPAREVLGDQTKRVTVPATNSAVEKFIAEKGITRCPPAIVAESTARLSPADRNAIAAHAEEQERLRVERMTKRGRPAAA